MKKSHLSEPYILSILDRSYEEYNKTDKYLDERIKIPPVLLYFAFNYRDNYYFGGV